MPYLVLVDEGQRRRRQVAAIQVPGRGPDDRVIQPLHMHHLLLEWPNLVLHPNDPFELVLWDHKSCAIDDLSLLGAMVTIETHFNASTPQAQFETLTAGTFGQ